MPRSPKDNQEIRDARREEILVAAARVFAEKGIARSKISDIASAAGLSHGLVYHYFESKDAIFEAIVEQMMAKIDSDLALGGEMSALALLTAGIERSRERMCAGGVEPNRVVSQAMIQGLMPDHLRERLFAHFGRVHGRVVDLLARAQREGDIEKDADPTELASALICLMRGMSIRMPGMPDLPFATPTTDTILRLLRPTKTPEDTRREPAVAARGSNARRK